MKRQKIVFDYRRYFPILIALLAFITVSCGSFKSTEASQAEFLKTKDLVESDSFYIENRWANPLRGSPIDLTGNVNFIQFTKDSVEVSLPYFGVRQMGARFRRDGGINFEGIPDNYKLRVDNQKQQILIEFEAEEEQEHYNFQITVYGNGNTDTHVNSSQRDAISFDGKVYPGSCKD